MREEIEIRRKIFEVLEGLGPHSKKVTRKDKIYFLKEYPDQKSFDLALKNFTRLHKSGLCIPDILLYDKNRRIMVSEFIEGETILDMLIAHDLDESIYEMAFNTNLYLRVNRLSIDFVPENFKVFKGKLCYLPLICGDFKENLLFQNSYIWVWMYGKDFANYLLKKGYKVDPKRISANEAQFNKNAALLVVKYYK